MKRFNYLYRALRREEIEAGNILIPKEQLPFKKLPRLGIDTRMPFVMGETEEHAVRQHQWKRNGYPTPGISTTPHFERAKLYARNGVVVKIDREQFKKYNIKEYIVNECLKEHPEDIAAQEDDEIILVKEDGGSFPKEIIKEIIEI